MNSLEQRVSFLEGRTENFETALAGLRNDFQGFQATVDRRFDEVDRRFTLVDRRFEQIDARFSQVDRRFEHVESRLDRIEQRFDQRLQETDEKIDRTFTWIVGLQAATLVAVLGTIVGALYR